MRLGARRARVTIHRSINRTVDASRFHPPTNDHGVINTQDFYWFPPPFNSLRAAILYVSQQPNPATQATLTEHWITLVLSYARFRRLFILRVEDAEVGGGDWDEVVRNPRINRKLPPLHLQYIIFQMVAKNLAVYEPTKQTRSILLYWRLPEEWAQVLHEWASSTGQLNTIMTFYEIVEPPIPTELSDLPIPILKKAIGILAKTARAQIIAVADGEGVRFLPGTSGR